MPSNKPKVVSYLNKDEHEAFKAFQEENELSVSEAVAHLIRSQLLVDSPDPQELVMTQGLEERLEAVERDVRLQAEVRIRTCEKTERLEEYLSFLESEVQTLRVKLREQDVISLTDDDIAAVTGQRVQTVWEWRHGLRKPRGKRILKALEPYEVRNGTWVTKR